MRWPGVIKPGTVVDGLFSAEDWLPTLVAAAGDPAIKDKLLKGFQAGGKSFKVHLDGYNQLPVLKGETTESPRKEFVYFDDDGNLVAYRDERFKYSYAIQYAKGMDIWRNPMMTLRAPTIVDLKADPFEYAVDGSIQYEKWMIDRAFLLLPAVDKVAQYLATYKEFPPRQRPASFSIDQVVDKLNASIKSSSNAGRLSPEAIMRRPSLPSRSPCSCHPAPPPPPPPMRAAAGRPVPARRSSAAQPQLANPASADARSRAVRCRWSVVPMAASTASASSPTTTSARNGRCFAATVATADCVSPDTPRRRALLCHHRGRYTVVASSGAADEEGSCALPGGKVCDADAYYAGTCSR